MTEPNRRRSALRFHCISVLLLASLTGCGGSERVPLRGRVLYNDEPLSFGSVMFEPIDGGESARATIEPDGSFVARPTSGKPGMLPGSYRVRITAFDAQRPAAASSGDSSSSDTEPSLGKSHIPAKYQSFRQSGLEVDIRPSMPLPLMLRLTD